MNDLLLRRLLVLGLLLGLLALGYQVLSFFLIPTLWAMILGYVSWPLYRRVRAWTSDRPNRSALLMVAGLLVLIGVPLVLGTYLLQQEVRDLYGRMQTQASMGQLVLPAAVQPLEWLRVQL